MRRVRPADRAAQPALRCPRLRQACPETPRRYSSAGSGSRIAGSNRAHPRGGRGERRDERRLRPDRIPRSRLSLDSLCIAKYITPATTLPEGVMHVEEALERLDQIHDQLTKSEVYRGFRVPAVAAVGLL